MATYSSTNRSEDGAVITFFGDVNDSITDESPNFEEVLEYINSVDPQDIDPDFLSSLVSPRQAVTKYVKKISDRIAFIDGELTFDGDIIDNSLSRTIISLSTGDGSGDPRKLVRFLDNLMTNPSAHSREQLYDWIRPRDITITNDGHFLAYKGLRKDFTSINSGPGIVNDVSYSNEHLDNNPGNVVEIARSKVLADSFVGCASGLHAGTYEYASSFAQGQLVLVKINPRDVVSVPTDCEAQKLRVSRYEVLESIEQKIDDVYYDPDYADAVDDLPEDSAPPEDDESDIVETDPDTTPTRSKGGFMSRFRNRI